MSDLTLDTILKGASSSPDGITFAVSENWKQGRTAFGGYSASLLLSGARQAADELPPLRSVLINFTGPISSPPLVSTRILRQGRNVVTVQADAHCEGKLCAQGTFSFGVAQDSHVSQSLPAPQAQEPEATEDFLPPNIQLPINFFKNFDVKLIEGERPFTGADRGYVRAWARHKDPAIWGQPEGLMSIADVLPPAVFSKAKKIGPNSSMTWICNFMTEELTTRDGWWILENELSVASNGFSSQVMRVWNTDGDLVIEGMQSVVIFV
ncbi:thioesterase family protein [Phaeobacter gallaeciensis]|uniref:Thioesterase family protein n=2 Tax=Roseobacteraceae TaxID=2854170 RepID=A0A366WV50_9RHOB|nr:MULTISPECIES: thioesterase family protein [Roseobacteraceae]MBT3140685.1 thioesterase family protein [Falsiruegeria litorea]MBT8170424.1 thioesterase family protein [Falsiruegeria litorea]RBW52651.1 thioesterase family protein [Phaeobacter gallaeciensis]